MRGIPANRIIDKGGIIMSITSRFIRIVFTALALFASAEAMAASEDNVERMEQERIQALIDADMPTLNAIYADDFFYNLASGQSLGKADYLARYESGDIRINMSESDSRDIRVYGNTALVNGIVHVNATISGENKDFRLRYLNVWIKRAKGWVLVARQSTNIPEK
jgi:ketosteroid isomerase-like protein